MRIRVKTPVGEIELCSKRLPNGETIWVQMPHFENRVFSAEQKKQQDRFRQAMTYAKRAHENPTYQALAKEMPMKTGR